MFEDMKDTFDAIARRAFEIFDAKGRRLGYDLDDWFQAEAELLQPVNLNISETDGALTARAEVPGFSEKDIEVTVEPQRLTISGRHESTEQRNEGKTAYTQRHSNAFYRVMDLPAAVDTTSSALTATYDRHVLTITLPKVAQATRRQIKVEPKSA